MNSHTTIIQTSNNNHFHKQTSIISSPSLSQSSSKSPKSPKSPFILYTKPVIPKHSHYHKHKHNTHIYKNSISNSYDYSEEHSIDDIKTPITIVATPSRQDRISSGSISGSGSGGEYIAPLTNSSIKHSIYRDRSYACKQRTFSDVYAGFSLKRGRLDSSMASMYKLSADDQRVLQRDEWKLLNALKSHDGNKAVIIDAIQKAKTEVLCNFMSFICLMLSDVIDNKYNIYAMKDDVIMVLKERIGDSIDLQQHLRFIIKCYPEIKNIFKGILKRKHQINCVQFWSKIMYKKQVYDGYNFKIENKNHEFKEFEGKIRDPILMDKGPIQLIAVRKILNSNAKPLLLDIYLRDTKMENNSNNGYVGYVSYFKHNRLCNGVFSSSIILKSGDDLRKDAGCMLVFKFMNEIWKSEQINYKGKIISILTYKIIPMSESFGCIELIPDCIGLRDINTIKKDLITDTIGYKDESYINNLIASSAAAYVSCLVIGIRDRHYDNQMIRKSDYKLFHIDFNFIFGQKASLDASELGITYSLAKIMDIKYEKFVELAVEAHQVLREYSQELIDFAIMAFSYLFEPKVIRKYISKKLRLNLSDDKSKNWLRKKLLKAPQNTQTALKNTIHKIAVNLHSSSNNNGEWD